MFIGTLSRRPLDNDSSPKIFCRKIVGVSHAMGITHLHPRQTHGPTTCTPAPRPSNLENAATELHSNRLLSSFYSNAKVSKTASLTGRKAHDISFSHCTRSAQQDSFSHQAPFSVCPRSSNLFTAQTGASGYIAMFNFPLCCCRHPAKGLHGGEVCFGASSDWAGSGPGD